MAGAAGRLIRVYVSSGNTATTAFLMDANKYITDIEFNRAAEKIDLTGVGDSNLTYALSLPDASITITGNDYSSTTATTAAYKAIGSYEAYGSTGQLLQERYIEFAPDGTTTAGARKIYGNFNIADYTITGSVAGKRGMRVTLAAAGDITFGAYS